MAFPRVEPSSRRNPFHGCLSLKVVTGLLALALLCYWSLDFSSGGHISQLGMPGVKTKEWISQNAHRVIPDRIAKVGEILEGKDRPSTEDAEDVPLEEPERVQQEPDVRSKRTDPPKPIKKRTEPPAKIETGDESIEDELGIEASDDEEEEVAWVPKKEKAKPQVIEPHASQQAVDLRAEIFECNYTDARSDFCTMRGDVQVNVLDKSFRLLARNASTPRGRKTIKPFPRKQFPHSLETVSELVLESVDAPSEEESALETELECSEVHDVPALVFSTAGHTGNYYHDMNDGWVPLFITSYPYEREVVFVIADPVGWWPDKYMGMINAMTKYPLIKLAEDQPVHCFPEVKFGLASHGDMAVDETRPPFIRLEWLGQRWAKVAGFPVLPTRVSGPDSGPLKLGWVHRAEKERNVLNEAEVLDKARSMGFEVTLLNRFRNMEEMFQTIQPLDVLMGLHGSGLSNFIFMRGNCVLIQLVPFQLEWFSDNSFGIGAQISRVKYLSPLLSWEESSLSSQYPEDSEVHLHPEQINAREGWQAWAHYYLEANVTIKMETVEKVLQEAKEHLLTPGAVAEHRPWLKPFDGNLRRR